MIIESETTKGKKFAIISRAGYIYNADKSKKTQSEEKAAEWYGCTKENLILIPGYHTYSCYAILEIKRDPNVKEGETPNRVLLNYYGIKFARALETRQPLFCYLGYVWLYNDGRVIESWLSTEDRSFHDSGVPKRVKRITSPDSQGLKPITDYYWYLGIPTTWGILHSDNSIDTLGSLSKEEISLLKEAGFKKDYFCNRRGSKISLMEKSLYVYDLINFARWSVSSIAKTSKEIKKQESLLPKMDPKCIIQVDSVKEDTIIRINRTDFVYIMNNNFEKPQDVLWGLQREDKFSFKINKIGEEAYRIYIKKNGNLSLYVRSGEEWISTKKADTFLSYDVFDLAQSYGLINGSLKNLFDNSPKLKYFRDFYHRNYEKIFKINEYDEESKSFICFNRKTNTYHRADILQRLKDLLKILQAYPAFCDTLDKLGHLDYLFYDSSGEFIPDHFLEVLSDSRYESLNTFFFKQKAKTLLDTMGINRYQWRTFLAQIKRDLEVNGFNDKEEIVVSPENDNFLKIREIIVNNYKLWNYLQKFFVNTAGKKYNWVDGRSYYSFLKEIPDNEFDSFIKINNELDNLVHESEQNMVHFCLAVSGNINHYRPGYEYSFSWLDFILGNSYSLIGNSFSWPTGEKVSIEKFSLLKIAKENYKNNLSATLYRDYLRLRENCARYCTAEDGFDINDWPLKVRPAELQSFHDRLVLIDAEIRRMAVDKRAAKENAVYQEKWENRIKKEKLTKFSYAPKDEERCILVPMKIVPELIFEGQKLEHCVGSYVGSVADGKETVLFLRKRDNLGTPYATIDIAYNSAIKLWEVRQAHTYRNGPITEEDKKFLLKWGEEKGISKESIRTKYGALCHL